MWSIVLSFGEIRRNVHRNLNTYFKIRAQWLFGNLWDYTNSSFIWSNLLTFFFLFRESKIRLHSGQWLALSPHRFESQLEPSLWSCMFSFFFELSSLHPQMMPVRLICFSKLPIGVNVSLLLCNRLATCSACTPPSPSSSRARRRQPWSPEWEPLGSENERITNPLQS